MQTLFGLVELQARHTTGQLQPRSTMLTSVWTVPGDILASFPPSSPAKILRLLGGMKTDLTGVECAQRCRSLLVARSQ